VQELEREIAQNAIEWLFKRVVKKDAEDSEKEKVFNYNIFPLLALMRQINDVAYKVLEGYAKGNIDDKKYREIADYIKRNHQKNNFELKKVLVELDEIIK
jgi:DNA-binding MltR family transcriptional regulator